MRKNYLSFDACYHFFALEKNLNPLKSDTWGRPPPCGSRYQASSRLHYSHKVGVPTWDINPDGKVLLRSHNIVSMVTDSVWHLNGENMNYGSIKTKNTSSSEHGLNMLSKIQLVGNRRYIVCSVRSGNTELRHSARRKQATSEHGLILLSNSLVGNRRDIVCPARSDDKSSVTSA